MSEATPELNTKLTKKSSRVDAAVKAKKGFRQKKSPTKKVIQQENDELRQALVQLQNTNKFFGQQLMTLMNNTKTLNAELQAMAGLLRCSKVTGSVKKGDKVMVDAVGRLYNDDGTLGKTFEGSSLNSALIELGGGKFIPGFEDQLVGAKLGEVLDIEVTFPEEYAEALKGKKARFSTIVVTAWKYEAHDSKILDLQEELAKSEAAAKAKETKEAAPKEPTS